ncbi:MAG: glycosyltransferase (plasmid) [Candidatus Manganitrophus sp.]|nr:MAG: glycosyltransferase [Candidatus Manganitrophus sp.]
MRHRRKSGRRGNNSASDAHFYGTLPSGGGLLRLQRKVEAKPNIVLRRYTADFLSHMKRADLSISMAGYNTCMNILTAGTKALLLPFAGNQNEEQTIRAEKLEALGVAGMIRPEELRPAFLAEKIVRALKAEPVLISLDMRGAGKSARFLSEMSRTSVRRGSAGWRKNSIRLSG